MITRRGFLGAIGVVVSGGLAPRNPPDLTWHFNNAAEFFRVGQVLQYGGRWAHAPYERFYEVTSVGSDRITVRWFGGVYR